MIELNDEAGGADIVARLRADIPETFTEGHYVADWDRLDAQRAEAADRIEALTAERDRLAAELAGVRDSALEEAAVAMENLGFFTDIEELRAMTKQDMSERTCHEGAAAIRALKGHDTKGLGDGQG